jgi:hypothetical protein
MQTQYNNTSSTSSCQGSSSSSRSESPSVQQYPESSSDYSSTSSVSSSSRSTSTSSSSTTSELISNLAQQPQQQPKATYSNGLGIQAYTRSGTHTHTCSVQVAPQVPQVPKQPQPQYQYQQYRKQHNQQPALSEIIDQETNTMKKTNFGPLATRKMKSVTDMFKAASDLSKVQFALILNYGNI